MQLTLPDAPSPAEFVPTVRLLHGDCLDVLPTLPQCCAQMVFADLPYGVTECKWDFHIEMRSMWKALEHPQRNDCIFVLSSTQPFGSKLISSNEKKFKYQLIWAKKFAANFASAKHRPLATHEELLIFAKGKTIYNPQMTSRAVPIKSGGNKLRRESAGNIVPKSDYKKKIYTKKHPTSILEFSCRADRRGLHPTQKPVALLEWLIRTYTNEGDTVLDPVSGSATTAIAALRTGRNVICIEKDPTYFEVGRQRVAAEQARLGHPVTV